MKDAAEDQGCHPEDVQMDEIFDEIIPANNHMLLDLVGHNLGLAYPNEMPFFDDGPSAFQVIYQGITEHLSEAVLDWLEDYETETLSAQQQRELLESLSYLEGR